MSGSSSDVEKGMGAPLKRAETLSMDPAVFEKLFLNPQTKVAGDLRKTFAVPTPLGLVGFGVALTPLACQLMGWRGTDQTKLAGADLATYIWFGGLMTEVAGLLEFFLGNTFAFVLFMGYGCWFLTYAATLQPFYGASALYASENPMVAANATLAEKSIAGQMTPGFTASFAFPVVFMTVLSFVFLICALRVNLVFVLVLLGACIAFGLLSSSLFVESEAIRMLGEAAVLAQMGDPSAGALLMKGEARLNFALKLVKGGGGAFFGAAMLGWYLTLAIMLAIVDFPIVLPVFDLSTYIKSGTQVAAEKRAKQE